MENPEEEEEEEKQNDVIVFFGEMGVHKSVIWEMGLIYVTRKELLFSEIILARKWEKKNVKRPSILRERERIGTESETCLVNIIALSLSLVPYCFFSPTLSLSFCFFLSLSASVWFRWERERERKREMRNGKGGCLYINEKTMGANWICLDITKEPLYTILVLLLCLCLCHFFSFF